MPQVRYKSWRYGTRLHWTGGRAGAITSTGKPAVDVASPPEFRGQPGVWTPEDLLVAAVESCVMTTFLHHAERHGLTVLSYESSAEASLEHDGARYRFTRVRVMPRVVLGDAGQEPGAERAMRDTERDCFVSNSLKAEVAVEPYFEVAPAPV